MTIDAAADMYMDRLARQNRKDEYLDGELEKAARLSWGWQRPVDVRSTVDGSWFSLDPPDDWLARETECMRVALELGGVTAGRLDEIRWHILRILSIDRSYAASSRRVEADQAAGEAR